MNRLFLCIAFLALYFQALPFNFKLDGFVYSTIDDKNVEVAHCDEDYYSDDFAVVIPASVVYNDVSYNVVRVGEAAFKNSQRLKRLVLPYSIKEIGAQAMADCRSLESVVLNSGLLYIGDSAFENSSVESLTIPSSVIEIRNKAFCNLDTRYVIFNGNHEISIGYEAFMGSSVERLSLSNSVASISEGCFKNCTNLKEVIIGDKVKFIGKHSFSGCKSLVSLALPSPQIDIDDDAFAESDIRAIAFSFTERPMFSSEPFHKVNAISLISIPLASTDVFYDWAGKLFEDKEKVTLENYDRFGIAWIYPGMFSSWKYEDFLPMGVVTLQDTDTMLLVSKFSDVTIVYPEIVGASFDILANGESVSTDWVSAQPDNNFDSPTNMFMLGMRILLEDVDEDIFIKAIDMPSYVNSLSYDDNLRYDATSNVIIAPNEYIYIYDTAGRLIATGKDSVATSYLLNGLYIARTPRQCIKINIRN